MTLNVCPSCLYHPPAARIAGLRHHPWILRSGAHTQGLLACCFLCLCPQGVLPKAVPKIWGWGGEDASPLPPPQLPQQSSGWGCTSRLPPRQQSGDLHSKDSRKYLRGSQRVTCEVSQPTKAALAENQMPKAELWELGPLPTHLPTPPP